MVLYKSEKPIKRLFALFFAQNTEGAPFFKSPITNHPQSVNHVTL